MTRLTFTVTAEIDGNHAADAADDLAIDVDAGELDQGFVNLLRAHLTNHCDTRDWRIVTAHVWPQGEEPTP